MTVSEKKTWLEEKIGAGTLSGMDDACFEFFFRAMHDQGFDFSDADRYAWLNTLFGYDIGADHAKEIIKWLYENDQDALELTASSSYTLEGICNCELGFRLNFRKFVRKTPEYISYSWNAA